LLDVILDSSKEESFIQLLQMLDSHVLKKPIRDVVSLELVLGSSEHPLNGVILRSILRDGERE